MAQASFDDVIFRAAVTLMKQATASRIDLYRDVWIGGELVCVRVKITADWVDRHPPQTIER